MRREEVLDGLPRWLREAGLEPSVAGDARWMVLLEGEWKRTIPVLLHVDSRHLRVRSMLCPGPEQDHDEVYALLLHRNERTGATRYALDDEGDVVLLGALPLEVVDPARVDELLGEVLATQDATFNPVLGRGFADYVAREQAWRAGRGMPSNPAFPGDTGE